jgi:hypothetical protein
MHGDGKSAGMGEVERFAVYGAGVPLVTGEVETGDDVLTTVALPLADLAASAVDTVLGQPDMSPSVQLHRLNLTVRRSCGCNP